MANYNLNHVCLSGNLISDPVRQEFQSGKSLVKFCLGVHEVRRGKDGKVNVDTYFFDVFAWGAVADNTAKYSAKGSNVIVDGKLVQDSWETKDGKKETRIKIEAARIYFNDGRRSESARPAADGTVPSGGARPQTQQRQAYDGSRSFAPRGVDVDRPAAEDVAVPF